MKSSAFLLKQTKQFLAVSLVAIFGVSLLTLSNSFSTSYLIAAKAKHQELHLEQSKSLTEKETKQSQEKQRAEVVGIYN